METTPPTPLEPTIEIPTIIPPPQPVQSNNPKLTNPREIIRSSVPFAIAAAAIICGISLFFIYQKFFHKEPPAPVMTVFITPTPTPTPIRYPTAVSQTIEFKAEQDTIASFSSLLQEFSKDDPTLNPPVLILPLGF